MIDAKTAGELSPDIDLDQGDFTDFGTEVSAAEMLQLSLLDFWFAYRMILIPMIIIGSLAAARMMDPRTQTRPPISTE